MRAHPTTAAEFAVLARQFVALVARPGRLAARAFLAEAHLLLVDVYAAAWRLPQVPAPPDDPPWSYGMRDDSGLDEASRLAEALGGWYKYVYVVNPVADPPAPAVPGSIVVSLLDIAEDLAAGLARWDAGRPDWACSHWRYGVESTWGMSAAGALPALQALTTFNALPDSAP